MSPLFWCDGGGRGKVLKKCHELFELSLIDSEYTFTKTFYTTHNSPAIYLFIYLVFNDF